MDTGKPLADALGEVIFVGMVTTRPSLLERVRDKDDDDSWREFFAIYEPFLTSVARRFGLNDTQAAEAVAEVLVICVQKLPEFQYSRQRGRFRGWLKTVTQRVVIGQWRRTQRGINEVPLRGEIEPSASDEVWDDWDRAHREHIVSLVLSEVRDSVRGRTWDCFDLHILQRKPAPEVAEELRLTVNAVYANASRVLQRVRTRCLELDEELSDD
ncbi:MAG: sigma-70 family RNA polymerase sigma factor [Planctomycetota bacterium]|nr:MAG: sigma-70 family RNA polymerase sigma factor [Planctomycetota bacterium]